jgi:hypothetical protein
MLCETEALYCEICLKEEYVQLKCRNNLFTVPKFAWGDHDSLDNLFYNLAEILSGYLSIKS